MKKKVFTVFLTCVLAFSVMTGCANDSARSNQKAEQEQNVSEEQNTDTKQILEESSLTDTVRIGALKGPTSMGLVKLLDESEKQSLSYGVDYQMETAADALAPMLLQSNLDMACIPANLASILYNKSEGKICVLAINTLGVLSIVDTKDEIHSIEDLKGKTIYATGEGTTPEYVLRYLLSENGIDMDTDVTMEWKSEATEIVSVMQQSDEECIALLPQPFVTVALTQIEGLKVQIDCNDSWQNLGNDQTLVTGVLVADKEFVENNAALVNAFLEDYKSSCEFAASSTDVEECATLVEKYDIVKAKIAQKALPNCHITYMDKEEMKDALSGYLQVLFNLNPQSVGGKLPGEDFYY